MAFLRVPWPLAFWIVRYQRIAYSTVDERCENAAYARWHTVPYRRDNYDHRIASSKLPFAIGVFSTAPTLPGTATLQFEIALDIMGHKWLFYP